ncbi:MAG TPA: FCD domain-containing protein [bacterium]|nr:FCD domain-containing protein [bacterium]HQL63326.1 FCD domain-containing protein [bacterium]
MKTTRPKRTNNKGSTTDGIFEWIGEYIRDQHIAIGDPLPSEDFIVQQTGISRTSVREALTRLRAMGIIDSRRKRGMRLQRSFTLLDFIRLLTDNNVSQDVFAHMGSFRSALEIGLAPEIFRRATYEDVVDLRRTYEKMLNWGNDQALWFQLNRKFHERLVRMSGNKLAIWFWELLDPFFKSMLTYSSTVPATEITLEKHRLIVAALEKRDAYAFEVAMFLHHLHKVNYDDPVYRGGPE